VVKVRMRKRGNRRHADERKGKILRPAQQLPPWLQLLVPRQRERREGGGRSRRRGRGRAWMRRTVRRRLVSRLKCKGEEGGTWLLAFPRSLSPPLSPSFPPTALA